MSKLNKISSNILYIQLNYDILHYFDHHKSYKLKDYWKYMLLPVDIKQFLDDDYEINDKLTTIAATFNTFKQNSLAKMDILYQNGTNTIDFNQLDDLQSKKQLQLEEVEQQQEEVGRQQEELLEQQQQQVNLINFKATNDQVIIYANNNLTDIATIFKKLSVKPVIFLKIVKKKKIYRLSDQLHMDALYISNTIYTYKLINCQLNEIKKVFLTYFNDKKHYLIVTDIESIKLFHYNISTTFKMFTNELLIKNLMIFKDNDDLFSLFMIKNQKNQKNQLQQQSMDQYHMIKLQYTRHIYQNISFILTQLHLKDKLYIFPYKTIFKVNIFVQIDQILTTLHLPPVKYRHKCPEMISNFLNQGKYQLGINHLNNQEIFIINVTNKKLYQIIYKTKVKNNIKQLAAKQFLKYLLTKDQ